MKKRFCSLFSIMLIIFLLILANCVIVSAITGSMGNARMVLYPEVNGWTYTTIEKSILVKNVNNASINITLIADEEGKKFIELIDDSFVLEPNNDKKARFIIKVRKEGTYEGRINVFFSPLEKSKEPSVVLSSTIIVIASKGNDYEENEESGEDSDSDGINIGLGTGSVIANKGDNKKLPGILILSISSFILLIILISLIFVIVKKKSLKKGEKRGDKLNGINIKKKK